MNRQAVGDKPFLFSDLLVFAWSCTSFHATPLLHNDNCRDQSFSFSSYHFVLDLSSLLLARFQDHLNLLHLLPRFILLPIHLVAQFAHLQADHYSWILRVNLPIISLFKTHRVYFLQKTWFLWIYDLSQSAVNLSLQFTLIGIEKEILKHKMMHIYS